MFDFRYHALSLVAVFLALGIGIVLGATLGDSVVSEANKDVRSSLRGDLVNARNDARDAHNASAQRDRFIGSSFGWIAGDQLRGQRVAVVSFGTLPRGVESAVRGSVEDAGGTPDSVSTFDANPDLAKLGRELGPRFAALGAQPATVRPLGQRLGKVLVRGGSQAKKLESAFPDDFTGDFRGADAVVVYSSPNEDLTNQSKAFDLAVIDGLRATGVPAAGVETSDTDPSQIPRYIDAGLSTVDDVDQPAGRIALVLVLAGAKGNFGVKSTAKEPLPPPTSTPRTAPAAAAGGP